MTESLPGGCWGIRVMTATRLSQKLLSKTCNLSFPQRGTGVSKENTTNTFIACGTWLKTPFYTSSAGVELPLGTQRIPHPLSLLFKSGAHLCGQMCLHKLVSTLSSNKHIDSFDVLIGFIGIRWLSLFQITYEGENLFIHLHNSCSIRQRASSNAFIRRVARVIWD